MALIVIVPLFIKPKQTVNITDPRQLADQDSQFLEIQQIRVHYKRMGTGKPELILIHGFGSNLCTWQKVMQDLSEKMTVIAYDWIGFGLTTRPVKGSWSIDNPYSTRGQTDLLIGLMDLLGIDKAILVGHSAGAIIATQAALQHRDRFAGLIIVDPMLKGLRIPTVARILMNSRWMDGIGPLIVRQLALSGSRIIRSAWHDPSQIPPETFASYSKPLQICGWDYGLWEYIKAEKSNILAKVGQFKLPVMIITGSDDRIVPSRNSVELYRWIPGAEIEIISDSGHVPQEEQPSHFTRVVSAFISKIRR